MPLFLHKRSQESFPLSCFHHRSYSPRSVTGKSARENEVNCVFILHFGSMISSTRCRFRSPFPKSKESKILCVLSRCVDVSEHTLFTSLSIYLTRKKIPEPTVCAPLATTEIFVFERILIDKLLRPGVANCDCCCWRDLTVDDFIFKTLRRARLAVGPTFM